MNVFPIHKDHSIGLQLLSNEFVTKEAGQEAVNQLLKGGLRTRNARGVTCIDTDSFKRANYTEILHGKL